MNRAFEIQQALKRVFYHRYRLGYAFTSLLAGLLLLTGFSHVGHAQPDPFDCVDPLMNSHNSRIFQTKTASVPFGMVQMAPDTVVGKTVKGGYSYGVPNVKGFTAPVFDTVSIGLHPDYYDGKMFVIRTKNNSAENCYIQSAKLNGVPLDTCWFYHRDFADGGLLELELGPKPNVDWGSAESVRPPSESAAAAPQTQ